MIYSKLTIALGVIAATVGPVQAATAAGLDDLIAAAKQEGELTLIALPHSWCGNSDMLAGFKAKYGLKVNEFLPDGASVDEIAAIKASKNNKGPQAPDVIDVGLSFGPSAKNDGLIQAYKVSTWEDVPATMKDSDPKALAVLSEAYTPRPSMAAPTMITLATPMMTPSSVRKLRSFWARMDSIARRNAF